MSEEEKEQFQSSNTCWIFEKLIDDDDEKVRDHCYITGKLKAIKSKIRKLHNWKIKSSIN